MTVAATASVWLGRIREWENTDIEGLKDKIRKWVRYATTPWF